jgi:hypothetical protein
MDCAQPPRIPNNPTQTNRIALTARRARTRHHPLTPRRQYPRQCLTDAIALFLSSETPNEFPFAPCNPSGNQSYSPRTSLLIEGFETAPNTPL